MIRFTDLSHHNAPLDLSRISGRVRGVALKATEGVGFVDDQCDKWYQQAKRLGLKRAFYHFANLASPTEEADYLIRNTVNYFYEAVPVLDWEGCSGGDQPVSWVNEFVRYVYKQMGVWGWIYGNPWRFNQGGVEPNCMRWLASYPAVTSPTFEQAEGWDCPTADGVVGAWQFCSDGRLDGYYPLDLDLFYGSEAAWDAYAKGDSKVQAPESGKSYILEGDGIRVTVELD